MPLFTLNEQLFEESLVLTVSQVKELLEQNAGILETLEELKVATLRFATFQTERGGFEAVCDYS